ncbi:MAG: hypothetical protein E7128_06755 [Rikenellaceae bacterium]|nr:hypothetical protein [Rikenellaceae bacterium]
MIIAVDFDGTCVSHDYPYIGKEIGAAPVLRELVAAGHDLILFTMRDGKLLKEAEAWFKENKIRLMDSNRNKEQVRWTSSPKVHADLYIDDSALGIPLKYEDGLPRAYVDWTKTRALLVEVGALEE